MPQPLRRTCSAQRAVHESRWTRVTSLVAMPSVVCVRCHVAESADAQPRALAAAANVRVPILITGAVAMGSPLHRNATPLFVGTARCCPYGLVPGPTRIPSSDPLCSGKRQKVRKRDQAGGSDEQRAADDLSRCVFSPAGHILDEIHQPSAPRGPRTLAMVQGATSDAASRTDTFQKAFA